MPFIYLLMALFVGVMLWTLIFWLLKNSLKIVVAILKFAFKIITFPIRCLAKILAR